MDDLQFVISNKARENNTKAGFDNPPFMIKLGGNVTAQHFVSFC